MFERLIKQIWHDYQVKINRESALYGIPLNPLNLNLFIPGGRVNVSQDQALYNVDMGIWSIQIFGLNNINMSEVLVTRAEDLSDIEMKITFSFDRILANGSYNLVGEFGWWTVDSVGDQPFSVDIANMTITPTIKLQTVDGYRFECGTDGAVIITELGIPVNYDDISFNFHNIGAFYNTVVNGVGVYIIKTSEKDFLLKSTNNILFRSFYYIDTDTIDDC